MCVCVSAAPVCPFFLQHLQQSLLLLALAGSLKWLELPFLSFCLSCAFLRTGLKKICPMLGRGQVPVAVSHSAVCAEARGMLNEGLLHALPALDTLSLLCILLPAQLPCNLCSF